MTAELIIGLIGFAIVSSGTPGPNNLMLLASGANFGLRRTLPHMFGISLGHAFMVCMVGMFLLQIFEVFPLLSLLLKVACVAYMLWLAWKIANAASPEGTRTAGSPLTFLQAAAFQWVNPKAWFMAITAISVYAPQSLGIIAGSVAVAAIFSVTNFPAITVWAWLGVQLRRWLDAPSRLRLFNRAMGLLLVASLYPVLAM